MLSTRDSTPYDFYDNFKLRAGILLIAEIGVISFVAIFCLLFVTSSRALKQYRQYGGIDSDETYLQPVSVLFLLAIGLDSIQAFGSVMSARWAFDGQVTEGTYCTAQAALKQFGNDGVALCTLAIAILTWTQIVYPASLPPRRARRITCAIIGAIFAFLILMITIPSTTVPHYYGNSGLWCWITDDGLVAKRMRIASEYAWFWLASLVSLILYGNIVFRWLRQAAKAEDKRLIKDAIAMGWYPIAYFVEVLPISLIRFLDFQKDSHKPAHGWLVLASVFFAASGSINVFLWVVTGRRFGFKPHNISESHVGVAPGKADDVDMYAYGGEGSPRGNHRQPEEVDIYSVRPDGNAHGAVGQYEWSAYGVDARR